MKIAGREETFEKTLRRFAETVTRICIVHCGNETDAEDCFQNVFIKLYQSDITFENDAHVRAWLIRVAINECTDMYRQSWKKWITLTDNVYQFIGLEESEEDNLLPFLTRIPLTKLGKARNQRCRHLSWEIRDIE